MYIIRIKSLILKKIDFAYHLLSVFGLFKMNTFPPSICYICKESFTPFQTLKDHMLNDHYYDSFEKFEAIVYMTSNKIFSIFKSNYSISTQKKMFKEIVAHPWFNPFVLSFTIHYALSFEHSIDLLDYLIHYSGFKIINVNDLHNHLHEKYSLNVNDINISIQKFQSHPWRRDL